MQQRWDGWQRVGAHINTAARTEKLAAAIKVCFYPGRKRFGAITDFLSLLFESFNCHR